MTQRKRLVAGKERHLSGWKRGPKDHRDRLLTASWVARLAMPPVASLRGQPGLQVENQGEIGSCVCNSSSSALEFVLTRVGTNVQLSRLWLYAKVRTFEGTPVTEDSGSFIRDAMKVLARSGCPDEGAWPYDLGKWNVMPPEALDVDAAKYKAALYYRCPTLGTIKACISQGFPVAGGFDVPENMFSDDCAKTGVIKFPTANEGSEGGHAVLFTGYSDADHALQFMNSWGEDWGDKGYGYLPYEFVAKNMADDFWSIRSSA